MKRTFFLIGCFFALCALFHKQWMGMAMRFALRAHYDCEMAYRSMEWREGKLVFSDLVLFDPTFHAHIERVSVAWNGSEFPKKIKGHLEITNPHISLLKERPLPQFEEGWFDFTVSISNGKTEWGGPVCFDLTHAPQASHLQLKWEDAEAVLKCERGLVEIRLENFKTPLLNPFLQSRFPYGRILEGRLTGRIEANREGRLISASLQAEGMGIAAPLGGIEEATGSVSYHESVGVKWEMEGAGLAQGKTFPFRWEGRNFFKSRWADAHWTFGEKSYCNVSKEDVWRCEGGDLQSEHASWLQAAAAIFVPELEEWELKRGVVSGKAVIAGSSWALQCEGRDLLLQKGTASLSCLKAEGSLTHEGGSLSLSDPRYDFKAAGLWESWEGEARLGDLQLLVQGGWDGEKCPIAVKKGQFQEVVFSGSGWIDPAFDLAFRFDGEWLIAQKKIPLSCPQFCKEGENWTFDLRSGRKSWDVFRLAGSFDGKEVAFHKKSHFLGAPLSFEKAPWGEWDVQFSLPWKAIQSAGPLLHEWGLELSQWPRLEKIGVAFQYKEERAKIFAQAPNPGFELRLDQCAEGWHIDLRSDLVLEGDLQSDGTVKGKGCWQKNLTAEFSGKIDPSFHCEMALSQFEADLSLFKDPRMAGKLQGQGHLVYDGQIEADLDFSVSELQFESHALENSGPIHFSYSSKEGALFRGVDLHGPFDCIVDLVKYDAAQFNWIFHKAQMHMPGSFLNHRLFEHLDKTGDLNFTADFEFASDGSSLSCVMREGEIPYRGDSYPVEDLCLAVNQKECAAALRFKGHLIQFKLQWEDPFGGRLILGEEESPLTIDWAYDKELSIYSIDGSFGGVDASFHAESPDTLIGTARVNFTALSELIPKDVAEVFEEIKMGKGYEFKGRLKLEENLPHFQGILCGKQIELFGFQFRTIMAQVDLGAEEMRIWDVKISDSAGVMKIDEIRLEGKKRAPWTIEIPHLSMHEFRPSLLQRPGGTVGPISPLVVRELWISDFKGILEEGKTYTADGWLKFINSYKREETVFDLPANVLSRIVGLDLELLIPVTGYLTFDIKDGFFNLKELIETYSEGKRSEFFLEMDPPPRMDLDGNLEIFIKMKQFVLLKFTESFLISIDGQLVDPQFHLKKKRFFGLM